MVLPAFASGNNSRICWQKGFLTFRPNSPPTKKFSFLWRAQGGFTKSLLASRGQGKVPGTSTPPGLEGGAGEDAVEHRVPAGRWLRLGQRQWGNIPRLAWDLCFPGWVLFHLALRALPGHERAHQEHQKLLFPSPGGGTVLGVLASNLCCSPCQSGQHH